MTRTNKTKRQWILGGFLTLITLLGFSALGCDDGYGGGYGYSGYGGLDAATSDNLADQWAFYLGGNDEYTTYEEWAN